MLTKKLLNYKTRGLAKKNSFPRTSMQYNQVNLVGLIFTIGSKEKHESIKSLVKRLEEDGKKVVVLAFLPKKQENHEFLFDFFTEKEVSFWGKINSDKVSSFAKQPFDYLFYIDQESNLLIRNVLAMSKAKCRISTYDEQNSQYSEMMVQVPGKGASIKQLVDEMYRYTKLLS